MILPFGVDNKVLEQFSEFKEFRQLEPKKASSGPQYGFVPPSDTASRGMLYLDNPNPESTPEEELAWVANTLRAALAYDLLEQTKKSSPDFFERLVVDLLLAMGYGGSFKDAGKAIGKSGDGGVDGLIKQDKLGLDTVYIQAKRWGGVVGSPELQKFVGSLEGHHATKGVFITTSKFSDEARKYLEKVNKKVVLIDGEQLAELMIDHGIGTTEDTTYTVKKLDLDYFSEE